jgi:cytochrome d ubiquinol oxidase subunit I
VSTAFAVAGVHALRLLRRPDDALHRAALRIALPFAAVTALLQPISGDLSAKDVAKRQPAKLAAMEAHYVTAKGAGLVIGGWPDDEAREVRGAIEIPYLLSILAHADPQAEVIGLDRIPRDEWPPTLICHLAFQIMVATGTVLALLATLFLYLRLRRPQLLDHPRFLRTLAWASPLGFIAVEAGWTVTEVGRQPWIIYGVLRTRDAVTPMPGLVYPFATMVFVYLVLSLVLTWIMIHLVRAEERGDAGADAGASHG